MGWGGGNARRLQYACAEILGRLPFPVRCAGNTTRLLRNSSQPQAQVPSAGAYLSVLQQGTIWCGRGVE